MSPDWLSALADVATVILAAIGGGWAYFRFRNRDEHFPRINLAVEVRFLDRLNDEILAEIRATVANQGQVPVKIGRFTYNVRGITAGASYERGGAEIRQQTRFSNLVSEGSFVPEDWPFTFVYPEVKAEYDAVFHFSSDQSVIRAHVTIEYLHKGRVHHATSIVQVPKEVRDLAVQ